MNILIVMICMAAMKISGNNLPIHIKDYYKQHFMLLAGKLILTASVIFLFVKLTQPVNSHMYIVSGLTIFVLFHFYEGFSLNRMFLLNRKKND